jgi:hypothetical protein
MVARRLVVAETSTWFAEMPARSTRVTRNSWPAPRLPERRGAHGAQAGVEQGAEHHRRGARASKHRRASESSDLFRGGVLVIGQIMVHDFDPHHAPGAHHPAGQREIFIARCGIPGRMIVKQHNVEAVARVVSRNTSRGYPGWQRRA